MRLIDADVTLPESSPAIAADRDGDTHAAPGLRPEVLADGAARRTKAMIHAALFKATGEAPTVGPYQVLKLLGEGGMGVVYAAYDDELERKVALKLIRGAAMRRPDGRARTLREARALARLSHPNVVHVYQVGEVDDEIYVAMEFLTGPTLRAWLAAQPRTWREVLAVFRQAGEGLAAAHRQGVIHRDFKPANVIVGDDGRVRVLDFGLAHFFGLAGEEGEAPTLGPVGEVTDVLLTQTGAVLGTPAYMAAEQFAGGRGDAKTDQFSFCTALYEALYGQRPFVGDKLEVLASAVRDGRVQPVKGRNEVPLWLHRVVMRGLLPDPALRWPGMDALLGALCPPEARPRWGRIAGAAGAAGVLLIGGMGYAFMREAPAPAAAAVAAAASAGQEEAAAQGRAAVIRSQDEKTLVEARAVLASDPLQTMRRLAALAGDDTSTWERARSLARAAELRGLPAQVLRAEWPLAEVQPLAGGLIADAVGGAVSGMRMLSHLPVLAGTVLAVLVWRGARRPSGPPAAATPVLADVVPPEDSTPARRRGHLRAHDAVLERRVRKRDIQVQAAALQCVADLARAVAGGAADLHDGPCAVGTAHADGPARDFTHGTVARRIGRTAGIFRGLSGHVEPGADRRESHTGLLPASEARPRRSADVAGSEPRRPAREAREGVR